MRPLVGITCYSPAGNETEDYSLPRLYVDCVAGAGGDAVLLVGGEAGGLVARLDGLILAGGGDVAPAVYGARPDERNYGMDEQRDHFELALAHQVLATGRPLLAICRGMQILNLALGGSLVAHVPDRYGEQVVHRLPPREPTLHLVRVETGSLLASVVGTAPLLVVSWHHQAVARLGDGLRTTAFAADGVLEAVEHDGPGWVLAVQWHPELNASTEKRQAALFHAFVRSAWQMRQKRPAACEPSRDAGRT